MSMRLAFNYCTSSANVFAHECVLKDVHGMHMYLCANVRMNIIVCDVYPTAVLSSKSLTCK